MLVDFFHQILTKSFRFAEFFTESGIPTQAGAS